MAEITITEKNFEEEVLKSDKPDLVDFWAEWCGPCKMMAPVLEEFAAAHPEVKVGKCNVDDEMSLSTKFNIMSIPTLAVFKNGELYKATAGFQPIGMLENLIK